MGNWIFKAPERKLVIWLLPRIPSWVETYHLTLATLVLSATYFVHSILFFGATGKFEISSLGMGPTEMRLVVVSVFRAQKLLWDLDFSRRKRNN